MSDILKDITIVLSDIEEVDDSGPYPVTRVYRFDFEGSHKDLEAIFTKYENLFIEGGMMRNEE